MANKTTTVNVNIAQSDNYNSIIKTINVIVNKDIDTWIEKTWYGIDINYLEGIYIWNDGNNVYFSCGSTDTQYILNKNTSTWSKKTWNGYSNINGAQIWKDGDNIYYSSSANQYVLDKSTSTWEPKTWNGLTNSNGKTVFHGSDIWTDGDNIYYSKASGGVNKQYVLLT